MHSYENLAESYDKFTTDVDYIKWADYYEKLFSLFNINVQTILDLACGTGSLSMILAHRGYELIGVDGSSEMLAIANQKAYEMEDKRPMFLCQAMEELDLYGTVDAAVCSLDSLNYLMSTDALDRTVARLRFFIRPGGLFLFDLNTAYKFQNMDGQVFLRDDEDHYCVWTASYDEETHTCRMMMDLFDRRGDLWERSYEEHVERLHTIDEVKKALHSNGFRLLATFDELSELPVSETSERVFYVALREDSI